MLRRPIAGRRRLGRATHGRHWHGPLIGQRHSVDYARHERRVCVTLDVDFHAHLAVSGAARPSTVRARLEAVNGRAKPTLRTGNWSHTRGRQPSVAPTTRKKWIRPIDQGRPTGDAALVVGKKQSLNPPPSAGERSQWRTRKAGHPLAGMVAWCACAARRCAVLRAALCAASPR